MKKLLSLLVTMLTFSPLLTFGYYYQSCSDLYGFGAISAGNGYCKCMSGYKWYGNKCVSGNTYCQKLYGRNVSYNSRADSCECSAGYVAYGGSCISGLSYCQKVYGYNATYNSWRNGCECRNGYSIYGGQCVSNNTVCQKLYGWNYHYDSFNNYCITY